MYALKKTQRKSEILKGEERKVTQGNSKLKKWKPL